MVFLRVFSRWIKPKWDLSGTELFALMNPSLILTHLIVESLLRALTLKVYLILREICILYAHTHTTHEYALQQAPFKPVCVVCSVLCFSSSAPIINSVLRFPSHWSIMEIDSFIIADGQTDTLYACCTLTHGNDAECSFARVRVLPRVFCSWALAFSFPLVLHRT